MHAHTLTNGYPVMVKIKDFLDYEWEQDLHWSFNCIVEEKGICNFMDKNMKFEGSEKCVYIIFYSPFWRCY